MSTLAVYPGSFDPLTNGHLDLIERGSKIFDKLIIGILRNSEKEPLFSIPERRAMIEEMTADYSNVEVDTFDGLLVEYGMRGLRAKSALLRRLPDHAVSTNQREHRVPCPHRDREVERGYDSDGAQRMPLLHHPVVRPLGRDGKSVQLAGKAYGEFAYVDPLLNFALGLGRDFARLESDDRG